MPYCPDCGNEVESGQDYCDDCGTKLNESTEAAEQDGPGQSQENSKEINSKTKIGGYRPNIGRERLSLSIAVIILIGIFVFVSGSDGNNQSSLPDDALSVQQTKWTSLPADFEKQETTQSALQVTVKASEQLKEEIDIQGVGGASFVPGETDEITLEGVSPADTVELTYNYRGESSNTETVQFSPPNPEDEYRLENFFSISTGIQFDLDEWSFPIDPYTGENIEVRNGASIETGFQFRGGTAEDQYYWLNISESNEDEVPAGSTQTFSVDIRIEQKTSDLPRTHTIDVPVTARYAGITNEVTVPVTLHR